MSEHMQIASEIFDLPVQGINLSPGTFGEQFSEQPTLLVFLRHLG